MLEPSSPTGRKYQDAMPNFSTLFSRATSSLSPDASGRPNAGASTSAAANTSSPSRRNGVNPSLEGLASRTPHPPEAATPEEGAENHQHQVFSLVAPQADVQSLRALAATSVAGRDVVTTLRQASRDQFLNKTNSLNLRAPEKFNEHTLDNLKEAIGLATKFPLDLSSRQEEKAYRDVLFGTSVLVSGARPGRPESRIAKSIGQILNDLVQILDHGHTQKPASVHRSSLPTIFQAQTSILRSVNCWPLLRDPAHEHNPTVQRLKAVGNGTAYAEKMVEAALKHGDAAVCSLMFYAAQTDGEFAAKHFLGHLLLRLHPPGKTVCLETFLNEEHLNNLGQRTILGFRLPDKLPSQRSEHAELVAKAIIEIYKRADDHMNDFMHRVERKILQSHGAQVSDFPDLVSQKATPETSPAQTRLLPALPKIVWD